MGCMAGKRCLHVDDMLGTGGDLFELKRQSRWIRFDDTTEIRSLRKAV